MACVVMAVIITMSLVLGAELGSKANPTTTTYVPRPEWYFFFLFEVLRVIKPPSLVPLATIGVPTICMILLFLLPFYDRGPERRPERRPIATITGIVVICAMAFLTYEGANAGSPTVIEMPTPAAVVQAGGATARRIRSRQAGGRAVGLPGVPQDRRQRQRRARAEPDAHRLAPARARRSRARSSTRRRRCRRSRTCRRRSSKRSSTSSRSSSSRACPLAPEPAHPNGARAGRHGSEAGQVRAMFDRIAGVYDVMNTAMTAGLHHRWRARAAELARVGPGERVLDVATGTGDLAIELARRVSPGGEVIGSDFAEAMLARARAKAATTGAALCGRALSGRDALALPYADDAFDAATVGFGARNFDDLAARARRDGARGAPGRARGGARDHDAHAAAAVAVLRAVVRPHRARARPGWRGVALRRRGARCAAARRTASDRATPTPTCPTRSSASRRRRRWRPRCERAGLREIAYVLTAGGIVAIHAGTVPAEKASMSAVSSTAASVPTAASGWRSTRSCARGGERLRGRMARTERHLERGHRRGGRRRSPRTRTRRSRAGGKRLRPLLVVLAAESAGGPPDERRRRGAARARGGRGRAGALGDARARRPDRRRAAAPRPPDGRRRRRARRWRSRPATCCSRGRSPSWRATTTRRSCARCRTPARRWPKASCCSARTPTPSHVAVERYLRRCELKTAALFEAACRLGALTAADGSSALADALGAFARRIGLAFQMLDDVLDVSGPVERTGKSRGTDLLDGTVTLPFILARERDPELARVRPGLARAGRRAGRASCASGSPRQARWTRHASGRSAVVAEAKAALPAILPERALGAARPGRRRGRRALSLRRV